MIIIVFVTYLFIVALYSRFHKVPLKLYYFDFLLIIGLIGFRGYDIGSSDTIGYIDLALGNESRYNIENVELAFYYYSTIIGRIANAGYLFLIITVFFSLYPIWYIIKKYSDNVHISLLCFFLVLNIYIMYFVCVRQIMGISVIITAIIYVLENKPCRWLVFFALLLLGYFFHNTSLLIGLFFLVFLKIDINRYIYICLCVISFLFAVFNIFDDFSIIGSLFLGELTGDGTGAFSRISYYLQSDFGSEGGNNIYYYVVLTLVAISHPLLLDNARYNSIYTKMFLVGVIIHNTFHSFIEIYRFAGLFEVFGLVSISFVFFSLHNKNDDCIIKNNNLKQYWKIGLLSLLFYSYYSFFQSTSIQLSNVNFRTNSSIVPYEFFWEDKYNY